MATTIKTPTRTVTITMTSATADGYDDGIDYSCDYIGNLVGSDGGSSGLTRCDCSPERDDHSWHADDDTADWWVEHCRTAESNEDRLRGLSERQRAAFDSWADAEHVYDLDIDDTVRAVAAHLDEMDDESKAAASLGSRGGNASAAALTPEQRKERGRRAIAARWAKREQSE